eukprot:TRINITY_DN37643_c0_g1_i1.p1 TRINITY_DN37643_c0_g1~~TRINITY_DN37643_c0_g1_i1.p1  ORF type:complete len:929 (-),score=124.25 TRINITY_DN37643_c0_g1_i1:292-2991(-)
MTIGTPMPALHIPRKTAKVPSSQTEIDLVLGPHMDLVAADLKKRWPGMSWEVTLLHWLIKRLGLKVPKWWPAEAKYPQTTPHCFSRSMVCSDERIMLRDHTFESIGNASRERRLITEMAQEKPPTPASTSSTCCPLCGSLSQIEARGPNERPGCDKGKIDFCAADHDAKIIGSLEEPAAEPGSGIGSGGHRNLTQTFSRGSPEPNSEPGSCRAWSPSEEQLSHAMLERSPPKRPPCVTTPTPFFDPTRPGEGQESSEATAMVAWRNLPTSPVPRPSPPPSALVSRGRRPSRGSAAIWSGSSGRTGSSHSAARDDPPLLTMQMRCQQMQRLIERNGEQAGSISMKKDEVMSATAASDHKSSSASCRAPIFAKCSAYDVCDPSVAAVASTAVTAVPATDDTLEVRPLAPAGGPVMFRASPHTIANSPLMGKTTTSQYVYDQLLKDAARLKENRERWNSNVSVVRSAHASVGFRYHQELLNQIPLFSSKYLSPKEQEAVISRMHRLKFRSGEWVCRDAESSSALFIVETGTCQAVTQGAGGEMTLYHLKRADYFGEKCMLHPDQPNSLGVRATCGIDEEVVVLHVCAEDIQLALGSVKIEELRVMSHTILLRSFPGFAVCNQPMLFRLAQRLDRKVWRSGQPITKEGESSRQMYVIEAGSATLLPSSVPICQRYHDTDSTNNVLDVGQRLGLLSLFMGAPMPTSLTARSAIVRTLAIDQKNLLELCASEDGTLEGEEGRAFTSMWRSIRSHLLRMWSPLSELQQVELEALVDCCEVLITGDVTAVIRKGERLDSIYFLEEGSVHTSEHAPAGQLPPMATTVSHSTADRMNGDLVRANQEQTRPGTYFGVDKWEEPSSKASYSLTTSRSSVLLRLPTEALRTALVTRLPTPISPRIHEGFLGL